MYNYPTYWMAKMEMVRLWTSNPARGLVRCAVCGQETRWPEAHHLYLSQRFLKAKKDVRNIVPVCNVQDSPECHARRVHGLGKKEAANRQFRILGSGDPQVGRQIVLAAAQEWGIPKVDIPEVKEEE